MKPCLLVACSATLWLPWRHYTIWGSSHLLWNIFGKSLRHSFKILKNRHLYRGKISEVWHWINLFNIKKMSYAYFFINLWNIFPKVFQKVENIFCHYLFYDWGHLDGNSTSFINKCRINSSVILYPVNKT